MTPRGSSGLQRLRVNDAGARALKALLQPVDQDVIDTGLVQHDGQRHAGRAGANDQDFCCIGQHFSLHLSTSVDFLIDGIAFVNSRWHMRSMNEKQPAKITKSDRTRAQILDAARRLFAERAIAVELARTGFFVYATGRSSRGISGPSEIGRPETIEETGDLIAAAGGAGSALVVDHEDPASVAGLVSTIERDHGRLDVLVNDIFGGDRYMEWDKPLWEHDWTGGLRMLQMGVHVI